MTDITELAQSLKAEANTTADAIDRLKAFPGDELIDLSQHEGEQVDIDITTLNEWYELSSPANILALVEALEKAQGMEAYWKTQCRGITDHCEELQARIAELEESHAQVIQSRDHYKRMSEEGLKQLAESRTVTVKLPEVRITVAESRRRNMTWRELGAYNEGADVAAERIGKELTAQGIKWEAE
ncbi:ead/Ea22-like family protein [Klebsiella aerogenes]|uniref:ead/Ea22-like family protein n=1 Tax=Klebsiella aerogenes TaxID=548 RepID=UPI00227843E1|nr:ead/Ea22-like family protein [Klebsiella aerogenes]MCY4765257.1 ead/Ea22-like family protein [Klebsiella aerogenes]